MQNSQKGIAPLFIIIGAAVIFLIVGGALWDAKRSAQNEQQFKATASPVSTASPTSSPSSSPSPLPTASPSPQPIGCNINSNVDLGIAPLNVNLSLSSTSSVSQTFWDYDGNNVGDNSPVAGNSTSYNYANPGDYNVRAQAKLSNGITTVVCDKKISVKVPHKVSCTVTRSDPSGGAAPFQAFYFASANFDYLGNPQGDDSITAAQWDFTGDGGWDTGFDSNSIKANYTYNNPGNYTAKLQVKTRDGLTSDICTKDIKIDPNPS